MSGRERRQVFLTALGRRMVTNGVFAGGEEDLTSGEFVEALGRVHRPGSTFRANIPWAYMRAGGGACFGARSVFGGYGAAHFRKQGARAYRSWWVAGSPRPPPQSPHAEGSWQGDAWREGWWGAVRGRRSRRLAAAFDGRTIVRFPRGPGVGEYQHYIVKTKSEAEAKAAVRRHLGRKRLPKGSFVTIGARPLRLGA